MNKKTALKTITAMLLLAALIAVSAVSPVPTAAYERSPGDVNGDGVINIEDIMAAVNHIFGSETLSEEALRAADINGNGEVDIGDILAIAAIIFEGYSPGSGNVEFNITTDKTHYVLGDKVTVKVEVKNISENPVYTFAGTTSNGANGIYIRLGSEKSGIYFCDEYKHILNNCMMYYGSLKPGETITQERTFDTADISFCKDAWKMDYLEEPPEIFIYAALSHGSWDHEEYYQPFTRTVPIALDTKPIDKDLAGKLQIYDDVLKTKILLAGDDEEIPVWISFESFDATKDYIDENFKDRKEKVLFLSEFIEMAIVELPRGELIEMADAGLNARVSLY